MKKYVYIILISALGLSFYSCEPEPQPNPPSLKLGPNTVWIDDNTSMLLEHVYATEIIFNGNSSQLDDLNVGDIMVSGIVTNAPLGYIRRITAINNANGKYYFTTEGVTLMEAFQELHVNYIHHLSADDSIIYSNQTNTPKSTNDLTFNIPFPNVLIKDADGNLNTTTDQIRLNGEATFNPDLIFDVDISNFQLNHAKIGATFTSQLDINLTIGADVNYIDYEREIKSKKLNSFTIPYTPIVITPVLRLNAGATGTINVNYVASYTHSSTSTSFIEYNGASWQSGYIETAPSDNFDGEVNGNADLKVYIEPGIDFRLWGLASNSGNIISQIYIRAIGTLLPTPGCVVKAGISAGIEAKLKIFGWNDTLNYPSIIDYSDTVYTCSSSPCGTVTDIDGNVYQTVQIGTQCWMIENLKVTKYRNGDPIPNVVDSILWQNQTAGAYCNYGNNVGNGNVYGRLYNAYAVTDSRNIAPTGWHVPDTTEFMTLINYLQPDAGDKMKVTSANNPPWNGTNTSGFSALPGGYRGSSFVWLGSWAYFRTATYDMRLAISTLGGFDFLINTLTNGYSIRCIKD